MARGPYLVSAVLSLYPVDPMGEDGFSIRGITHETIFEHYDGMLPPALILRIMIEPDEYRGNCEVSLDLRRRGRHEIEQHWFFSVACGETPVDLAQPIPLPFDGVRRWLDISINGSLKTRLRMPVAHRENRQASLQA